MIFAAVIALRTPCVSPTARATISFCRKVPLNGEDLALEVMTADDYGTNLGLVVHEIWWGHKDTMPGLP